MSRTYRRKLKSRKMRRGMTGKTRNGDALTKELPPCYQNARRTHCAAAGVTKWWFHSKGAAVEAAKYNYFERFNRGQNRKYERAYHCSACDGWHLTTMDYKEWKNRKQELADLQGIELDENGNFKEQKPLRKYYGQ